MKTSGEGKFKPKLHLRHNVRHKFDAVGKPQGDHKILSKATYH